MIDSEITSNRCNHIWLCTRSLDGDTVQLQNGELPCDVAQYILVGISMKKFNYLIKACEMFQMKENAIGWKVHFKLSKSD